MSFHCEEISSYDHESVSFGIDKNKTISQLRKLADEIESGWDHKSPDAEYIVFQGAETKYSVEAEDYAMTTITLRFATKKGAPPFRPASVIAEDKR